MQKREAKINNVNDYYDWNGWRRTIDEMICQCFVSQRDKATNRVEWIAAYEMGDVESFVIHHLPSSASLSKSIKVR